MRPSISDSQNRRVGTGRGKPLQELTQTEPGPSRRISTGEVQRPLEEYELDDLRFSSAGKSRTLPRVVKNETLPQSKRVEAIVDGPGSEREIKRRILTESATLPQRVRKFGNELKISDIQEVDHRPSEAQYQQYPESSRGYSPGLWSVTNELPKRG